MEMDSIVVMESGAHWPSWVDEEAGAVSNVVVLARQGGESVAEFEARARLRLESLVELAAPRRGVLVCGPCSSNESSTCQSSTCRARIAQTLIAIVSRSGGGEVVIVGEDDFAAELASHARKLHRRDRSKFRPVSVRFRALPQRVERRVA
jgi:hypothetical protein